MIKHLIKISILGLILKLAMAYCDMMYYQKGKEKSRDLILCNILHQNIWNLGEMWKNRGSTVLTRQFWHSFP